MVLPDGCAANLLPDTQVQHDGLTSTASTAVMWFCVLQLEAPDGGVCAVAWALGLLVLLSEAKHQASKGVSGTKVPTASWLHCVGSVQFQLGGRDRKQVRREQL